MDQELYPGHADELRRKAERDAQIAGASAKPLPGPLFAAFTAPELQVLGITLRPVVHSDHVHLQRLDSPFLKNLMELQKAADQRHPVEATDEEVWEFVYLFTLAPRAARALLASGRSAYREAAAQAIGDRHHQATVLRLAAAAKEHYLASWATAVGYEPRAAEDGTVFTPPPAGPMTASAGGSTTSPAC